MKAAFSMKRAPPSAYRQHFPCRVDYVSDRFSFSNLPEEILPKLCQFLYHKHFILGLNIIAAYRTIANCSVAQGL